MLDSSTARTLRDNRGEAYEWAARMIENPQQSGQPAPLIFMRNAFGDPVLERPKFVELRRRLGYTK
jgi:hypothetical protein